MAQTVELQNTPNQNFQLLVEQDLYNITIRSFDGLSFVSITRGGEDLISNVKAMPNQPIIESEYLFSEHGNFIFSSEDLDTYPTYEDYGINTIFQYLTKEEVANAS